MFEVGHRQPRQVSEGEFVLERLRLGARKVFVEPVVIRCAADDEDIGGVGLKLRRKRNRAAQVETDKHSGGVGTSACAGAYQEDDRSIGKQCLAIVLDECQAGFADRDHQVESPSVVLADEELAQRHLIVVVGEARDID